MAVGAGFCRWEEWRLSYPSRCWQSGRLPGGAPGWPAGGIVLLPWLPGLEEGQRGLSPSPAPRDIETWGPPEIRATRSAGGEGGRAPALHRVRIHNLLPWGPEVFVGLWISLLKLGSMLFPCAARESLFSIKPTSSVWSPSHRGNSSSRVIYAMLV